MVFWGGPKRGVAQRGVSDVIMILGLREVNMVLFSSVEIRQAEVELTGCSASTFVD